MVLGFLLEGSCISENFHSVNFPIIENHKSLGEANYRMETIQFFFQFIGFMKVFQLYRVHSLVFFYT